MTRYVRNADGTLIIPRVDAAIKTLSWDSLTQLVTNCSLNYNQTPFERGRNPLSHYEIAILAFQDGVVLAGLSKESNTRMKDIELLCSSAYKIVEELAREYPLGMSPSQLEEAKYERFSIDVRDKPLFVLDAQYHPVFNPSSREAKEHRISEDRFPRIFERIEEREKTGLDRNWRPCEDLHTALMYIKHKLQPSELIYTTPNHPSGDRFIEGINMQQL